MRVNRKIIWILVSCLMVLSIVMASCGPAEEEKEEAKIEEGKVTIEGEKEEEKVEKEVVVEEKGLLPPEVPKYGGVYTRVGGDPPGFDPAITQSQFMNSWFITNEAMLMTDWTKGPAGTGEVSWQFGHNGLVSLLTGALAESYELPDDETIIFHIRKGVHWWNKPPVNGREFTASDAAWSIEREWTSPTSFPCVANAKEDWLISAKAIDKYTLEIKVPSRVQGLHVFITGEQVRILPPESVEQYGDITDWENALGTGPWMLTDYIPASSLTYERNPNYWMEDPIHPGNKFPYPDGIKELIIADASTRLAAFRTGKLDETSVSVEDWQRFMSDNPDLKYEKTWARLSIPAFRCDKPELPFYDVRVRQAANLAVNQKEILEGYYLGYGELLGYPFNSSPDHARFYTPLEQMPEAVQELFDYKPDKARQLLAEAGYPDGFKTHIICSSATADFLSIIREYLLAVGIDMEIQPQEQGTFQSMQKGRRYDQMIVAMDYPHLVYKMHNVRIESMSGPAFFEHPLTRAAYNEVLNWLGKDDAKVAQALKGMAPVELENCWGIWVPVPYTYIMWWPWFQNYHGETNLGSGPGALHRKFIWIDQAMKKSMGY